MLKGEIVAVDLFPTFLNKLKENYDHEVKQGNVTASLRTIAASMDSLPFDKEEFDIIWSEGAIYNIGFERGVNYWKHFLKKEGILAVSELSWTTRKRPSEVELFWNSEYPEMNTIAGKTAILEDAGYKVLGHFILPDNCWTDNYYLPLLKRHNEFLQAYGENELARQIVEKDRQEFELYKKYRSRGLQIYQVSLDADEHYWKTIASNLPWICVRDAAGVYSSVVSLYGVQSLPSVFLINRDNELRARGETIKDLEAAVRELL